MRIYEDLPPDERMTVLECALATAGLCLLATVGAALIRVRIEIKAATWVRVVNPFCTWTFHTANVLDIDERIIPSLSLITGERIYLVAAERSAAMRLGGKQVAGVQAVKGSDVRDSRDRSSAVTKDRRGTAVYAVPWLAGAILSLVGLHLLP
ncbi:hypothetical protein [Georgenia satyanarayanai]|uniref:hypothetical protein n=1 Tax=Georgenia satyanarayanai TaxID=860221 RepID=UPI0012643D03|nr:hypothetical protein [Georgenia satyanarayanai]